MLGTSACPFGPTFFTREVRLPVLFADLPPALRRRVDAGSSKVQERQPTCLFVQVIIGCATAKAGCLGSFGSSGFYFFGNSDKIVSTG